MAAFGVWMLLFGLFGLLSNKPDLLITSEVIRYGSLRSTTYIWSEIENVYLSDVVKHSHHTGTGRREWYIYVIPRRGKVITIYPAILRLKEQELNEKEIHHLIDLAFNRKPLQYKQIRMTDNDYYADSDKFFRRLLYVKLMFCAIGIFVVILASF